MVYVVILYKEPPYIWGGQWKFDYHFPLLQTGILCLKPFLSYFWVSKANNRWTLLYLQISPLDVVTRLNLFSSFKSSTSSLYVNMPGQRSSSSRDEYNDSALSTCGYDFMNEGGILPQTTCQSLDFSFIREQASVTRVEILSPSSSLSSCLMLKNVCSFQ